VAAATITDYVQSQAPLKVVCAASWDMLMMFLFGAIEMQERTWAQSIIFCDTESIIIEALKSWRL
jgi:hypothetical protein